MKKTEALTKKKNIIIAAVIVLLLLVGHFAYILYQDNMGAHGRLYPSKQKMCEQFATSYLRTIQEVENINDFGGNQWERAIVIESEIMRLCQLDLKDEALESYETTNIQIYLDEYRHE